MYVDLFAMHSTYTRDTYIHNTHFMQIKTFNKANGLL